MLNKLHQEKFGSVPNLPQSTETTTTDSSEPSSTSDVPSSEKDEDEKPEAEDDQGLFSCCKNNSADLIELMKMMMFKGKPQEEEPRKSVLDTLDVDGVAKAILSGKVKNIVVMSGAGISVASGIPDFRTPGMNSIVTELKISRNWPLR